MKKVLLIILVSLVTIPVLEAQKCNEWNWPENKFKAEEKLVLVTDNIANEQYKEATPHLRWLLINTPALHKSIYIHGVKIYQALADKETDPSLKRIYEDSVMAIYDLRIKICDDNGDLLNRKAFDAYKFYRSEGSKFEYLYALFKETVNRNLEDTWLNNLVAYMNVARKYYNAGGIKDDEFIRIYDQISGILDNMEDERARKVSETVDQIFVGTIDISCNIIEQKFFQKFKNDPANIELGKKVLSLTVALECTEEQFFLDAAKMVFEIEPTYGRADLIGDKLFVDGKLNQAKTYYDKAINLAENNENKADIYLKLYSLAQKKDDKVEARNFARKALKVQPDRTEVHSLIGNLYMSSFQECRRGENRVEDRLVFLAAYEEYLLAGDKEGMSNAREQFPSKEELHIENHAPGDKMKCDCWIDVTVTLRTRD